MFERFTAASRQVIDDSQREARRLHHDFIGCEHLLLALTLDPQVRPTLAGAGIRRELLEMAIRGRVITSELDADALGRIGIDLGVVRDRVEATFGTGALEAAAFALDRPARRWPRVRSRSPRPGARGRNRPVSAAEACSSKHLRLTARTKQALERALRLSIEGGSRTITTQHVTAAVLGMEGGMVPLLLAELGVDREPLLNALYSDGTA